jgi:hypothetical protein
LFINELLNKIGGFGVSAMKKGLQGEHEAKNGS